MISYDVIHTETVNNIGERERFPVDAVVAINVAKQDYDGCRNINVTYFKNSGKPESFHSPSRCGIQYSI